jgi:hypothetical protein
MFEIPDLTGRDPEYIQRSLAFFNYHVSRTMSGEDQTAALKTVKAKVAEFKITLEPQEVADA